MRSVVYASGSVLHGLSEVTMGPLSERGEEGGAVVHSAGRLGRSMARMTRTRSVSVSREPGGCDALQAARAREGVDLIPLVAEQGVVEERGL
eukprot:scaffold97348_cov30-Tisochrysis_lutea.AAC.4